jgi:hypothetical protein
VDSEQLPRRLASQVVGGFKREIAFLGPPLPTRGPELRATGTASPRSPPTPDPVWWQATRRPRTAASPNTPRVEDRIHEAEATGPRNLPCHRTDAIAAWLEIILAATDLVAWSKLIGFTEHLELTTCEIDTTGAATDRCVGRIASALQMSGITPYRMVRMRAMPTRK